MRSKRNYHFYWHRHHNLAGAETGFETFMAGVGNSNTCYYCIAHQSGDEFEVGLGTVTDATHDTLARTTIIGKF